MLLYKAFLKLYNYKFYSICCTGKSLTEEVSLLQFRKDMFKALVGNCFNDLRDGFESRYEICKVSYKVINDKKIYPKHVYILYII